MKLDVYITTNKRGNKMKKISIIIPVYNAEKYIEKCLYSIKKQTYSNYEIIIVDDGSKDNSLKMCKKFKNENKNIILKIFTQKNEGPSSARNRGIANAKGDYITFVDSDDYLEENLLEALLNCCKKDTMIRSNYKTFKNNKIFNNKTERGKILVGDFIEKILANSFPGCVWGCLFETKIIKKMKFSSELHFMEDTLFLVEYLNNIKYVKFVEANYYYCLSNNNSITLSSDNILNNIKSFNKSLDEINLITKNSYEKLIDNKKIILIEKELAKVSKFKELKMIINNQDFINIINKIRKDYINSKIYSILLSMYLNEKILLIYMYIDFRKILKKIKKLGEKE